MSKAEEMLKELLSGHETVTCEDGNEYDLWTVGFVDGLRLDIARQIIREVEEENVDTHCVCDVRIRAFKRLKP